MRDYIKERHNENFIITDYLTDRIRCVIFTPPSFVEAVIDGDRYISRRDFNRQTRDVCCLLEDKAFEAWTDYWFCEAPKIAKRYIERTSDG